jgi:hypothetical protein
MSGLIMRQIKLIERLYEVFEKLDKPNIDAEEVKKEKDRVQNTLIENYVKI